MEQNQEKQLEAMNHKLTAILTLLRGNDLDRTDTGMTGIQDDHAARIAKLEKFRDRGTWVLMGMGAPASWGIIELIIKIFIPNH